MGVGSIIYKYMAFLLHALIIRFILISNIYIYTLVQRKYKYLYIYTYTYVFTFLHVIFIFGICISNICMMGSFFCLSFVATCISNTYDLHAVYHVLFALILYVSYFCWCAGSWRKINTGRTECSRGYSGLCLLLCT